MQERTDLKIWLSYVSYPITTAAYWERALRSRYNNVITIGPKLPDQLIDKWDLKNLKLPIIQHNIHTNFSPDLAIIKEQLDPKHLPDVYIWVESVSGYSPKNIKALGCTTVCYLIDSHVSLENHLEWAKEYDYVFVAQKEYIPTFKKHVHENIFWLPLGADPEVHSQKKTDKVFDVGFVGSLSSEFHQRRVDLLNKINDHFPVAYKRCFAEEMSLHFSQSKIVFNNAIKNDLNMRVFEAMATGSLLLTDKTNGNGQEMFFDGVDYVLYDDDNILEKIEYYLRHDDEREKIASKGRETILNAHTYLHRVEELLDVVTGEKDNTRTPEEWRELSLSSESKYVPQPNSIATKAKRPERSFIIPVIDLSPSSQYNIKTLLNDLKDIEGEVVVIFNSMEMYEELKAHPRIDQFAAIKKNVGVSRAWNIGLNIARAPISFILNSDLHIEEKTVIELEDALEKLPMAAIVGPQGSYINFESLKMIHYFEKGSFDKPMQTDDVSGFLFAVKTELFNSSVIQFDNQYTPCYTEEWDIALQCKLAGMKTYIVPTIGYDHTWGGSIGSMEKVIKYYDEQDNAKNILIRNREKFIKKWSSLKALSEKDDLLVSYWVDEQTKAAEEIARTDIESSIKIMLSVINEYPNYIPALEYLAKYYLKSNNLTEALKVLGHIEKLDPDHKIKIEEFSHIGIKKQQVI